ncbi:MAG: alkaline phosphatase family protein [Candidatus Aminicenantales bacterium]
MNRRQFLKAGAAGAAWLGFGSASGLVQRVYGNKETARKVIILGCDGMDSGLVQRWLQEGRLPAFARLLGRGDFRPLTTSIPPQSPVAWSNFITGCDPGGHGIFDFMHRDPRKYFPVFSASLTEDAKRRLRLGSLVIPLSGGQVINLRKGKALWQVLEEHDIPATIFKIPANYPPVPTRQRTISGMGTPDILGSYGICNYYTTKETEVNEDIGGARAHKVYVIGNRVDAKLPGPVNSFRQERPETSIDFQVWVDPVHPVAKVRLPDQEFILKEKEWSGWKRVRYHLMPTQSVSGICLFYLKEVRPEFKLYISPVNIDPAGPALPLSTPEDYCRELDHAFGPFFTKGLPADTSALDNDLLDEDEFLAMDNRVLEESKAMLDYELRRFEAGLLFFYISSTDQRQHMFWRFLDKDSPTYDPASAARYGNVIPDIYVEADQILDTVMSRADKDTVIMVMSDHGFNPFNREFNLNTWLWQNGYHKLIKEWKGGDMPFFENTDWSRSKAYGLGLNGLYLNMKGREAEGIVNPGAEAENLLREIASKLEQTVDPKTGRRAIRRAFLAKDVYHGPYVAEAPDIILGFDRGYRISWGSPTGRLPEQVFADNLEKWSGDHMGAPEVIPGILAVNRKVRAEAPALYDLAPSVLDIFGISRPKEMRGRTIF